MPKQRGQPEDVKQIIVKAFQRGKKAPEIAEIVNVSERTVRRLWTYTRKYGVPSRPSTGPLGRPVKMNAEQVQAMLAFMIQHSYTFWIKDLFEHLKDNHGWTGCEASVRRKIVDLGFKKKEPWHKSQMTVWEPPEQPVLPPSEGPETLATPEPETVSAPPEALLASDAQMLDPDMIQPEEQFAQLTEHPMDDTLLDSGSTGQQPDQQIDHQNCETQQPNPSPSNKKSKQKAPKPPVQPPKLPALTPMAGSTTCGEDHLRLQVKSLQHELAQSKHQVLQLQRELGRYISMQQAHLAQNQTTLTYQSPYLQAPDNTTHQSPYHTDPSASHEDAFSSTADPATHQGSYQATTDAPQAHTSLPEANMFDQSYDASEAAHPSQYQPAADMGYADQHPTGPEMGDQDQYQAVSELAHQSPYQATAEHLAHQSPFMSGHEEVHG